MVTLVHLDLAYMKLFMVNDTNEKLQDLLTIAESPVQYSGTSHSLFGSRQNVPSFENWNQDKKSLENERHDN